MGADCIVPIMLGVFRMLSVSNSEIMLSIFQQA